MRKTLAVTTALTTIMLSCNTALADERDKKIELLQKQMQAMMEELQSLKQQQHNIDKQVSKKLDKKLATLAPAAGNDDVKITMKPSPKIESSDGLYSFQPFGRVHLDYTWFDDDQHNHPDNSDWRRARLGVKGKLGKDFNYKYEMDFADTNVAYKEIYLQYTGLDFADLKIGHFKPFQGLNELNSANYISLIERASPMNVFARGETTGIALQSHGDMWSAHLGVFGEPAGSTSDSDDEDSSVAARVTLAPFHDKGSVLHLGASGSMRSLRNDANTVSFSTRGETGDGDSLINTGTIAGADTANVYGVELAGALGGLHGQAEYLTMDLSRNGASDADFDGWYAQAGYILTGESRPYKVSSGTFSRIKPLSPFDIDNGGWGAWELVGRYSNTDLNDTSAGITGGEMDVWTAGVNWYLNNHFRVMLNYRDAETDENAVVANDEPKSVTIRTQFDF